MKRLTLVLALIAVIVSVIGVVSLLNNPGPSPNTNNILSFTYIVGNGTVTFNAENGFTNYAWDFGDLSTGAGSSVTHAYETNGSYTVSLTANPLTDPSTPVSTSQQVIVNFVTTLVHHYFENLNVTMGNKAT